MIVEELIKIVRTDFMGVFSDDYISNNDLMVRSFSEAQRQACNRTDFIFDDSQQITLIDGQASYAISSDTTSIDKVIFDNAFVEFKTRKSLDSSDPLWRTYTGMAGKSVRAIIESNKIRFTPSPDIGDDAKTITLELYKLPGALSSISDTPEIPEEYHRDLIYWVLFEAFNKLDNLNRANYYLTMFNSVFGRYISSEQRLIRMQGNQSLFLHPTKPQTRMTRDSYLDWS